MDRRVRRLGGAWAWAVAAVAIALILAIVCVLFWASQTVQYVVETPERVIRSMFRPQVQIETVITSALAGP